MKQNIKKVGEWLKETINCLHHENVTNRCDDISLFVGYIFEQEGIHSCVAIGEFLHHPDGEYHVWNMIEGNPFDLSISQFGHYSNGWISKDIYDYHYQMFGAEEFEWNEELSKTNTLWQLYIDTYLNIKKT